MTALTLLSHLCISTDTEVPGEVACNEFEITVLCIDLDWAKLVSLKVLELCGNIQLTDQFQFSSLVTLGKLEVVKVETTGKLDKNPTAQLFQLAHKLGLERPDVQLFMH